MSNLSRFLKELKQAKITGRRILRHGDPAKGIEYNQINGTYYVSKEIWRADIARTPQIVRDIFDRTDVHGQAWNANQFSSMIHYRESRAKGNRR